MFLIWSILYPIERCHCFQRIKLLYFILHVILFKNKLTFAVHHPLDDYVVIAVNLTGNSQTLKHVNASVFFAGLVYGRDRFLGFGFPIGLTVLPKGGMSILIVWMMSKMASNRFTHSVGAK